MKKLKLLYLSGTVTLALACETGDVISPRKDYTDAIQLNKGNYWVYQAMGQDLTSSLITFEARDSIYIARDTIVQNKLYYIFENPFGMHDIKSQVASEIIDVYDNIEFSGTNFHDTLYRNKEAGFVGFMQRELEYVTVPAGTFNTACFLLLRRNSPAHHPVIGPGNPSVFNREYSVARKVWYARNIGIVRSVQYFSNTTAYILELERYQVVN